MHAVAESGLLGLTLPSEDGGGGAGMAAIALNARFYSHLPTGMQRYGLEMAKRLAEELFIVRPRRPLRAVSRRGRWGWGCCWCRCFAGGRSSMS